MKIGSSLETQALGELAPRPTRTPAAGLAVPAAAGDQVSLSAAGTQMSAAGSEFDSAKVDAIRKAIQAGHFTVNAGAIADRLIADATALLAPRAGS